jgi:hypothetical protein
VGAQEDDVAKALAHEGTGDGLDVGRECSRTGIDGPGSRQLERVAVGIVGRRGSRPARDQQATASAVMTSAPRGQWPPLSTEARGSSSVSPPRRPGRTADSSSPRCAGS